MIEAVGCSKTVTVTTVVAVPPPESSTVSVAVYTPVVEVLVVGVPRVGSSPVNGVVVPSP